MKRPPRCSRAFAFGPHAVRACVHGVLCMCVNGLVLPLACRRVRVVCHDVVAFFVVVVLRRDVASPCASADITTHINAVSLLCHNVRLLNQHVASTVASSIRSATHSGLSRQWVQQPTKGRHGVVATQHPLLGRRGSGPSVGRLRTIAVWSCRSSRRPAQSTHRRRRHHLHGQHRHGACQGPRRGGAASWPPRCGRRTATGRWREQGACRQHLELHARLHRLQTPVHRRGGCATAHATASRCCRCCCCCCCRRGGGW